MGDKFHLYGIEALKKWFHGESLEAMERFPRVTMCRFGLRTFGDNIQRYAVQCLLPINIFNEKVKEKKIVSCCNFICFDI